MALNFSINLAGKEQIIVLRQGMIIGRVNADINLNDPMVSSRHAVVRCDAGGNWTLEDLGSRNAINFEGRKVKRITLKPGVNFSIGQVFFKTIDVEDTVAKAPKPELEEKIETWFEKISRVSEKLASSAPTELRRPYPLKQDLTLSFISGIQFKTRWVVGYLPRSFGSESPEFTILEEQAPGVCFRLESNIKGVQFSTDYPAKVLLNGKPIKSDLIKSGDEIIISQTKIKLGFL